MIILEIISNILIIITTTLALLAFYTKVKIRAIEISEMDDDLYWEALCKTRMNKSGGVSRPEGYQRFRWHFHCYKLAFRHILLFW